MNGSFVPSLPPRPRRSREDSQASGRLSADAALQLLIRRPEGFQSSAVTSCSGSLAAFAPASTIIEMNIVLIVFFYSTTVNVNTCLQLACFEFVSLYI